MAMVKLKLLPGKNVNKIYYYIYKQLTSEKVVSTKKVFFLISDVLKTKSIGKKSSIYIYTTNKIGLHFFPGLPGNKM